MADLQLMQIKWNPIAGVAFPLLPNNQLMTSLTRVSIQREIMKNLGFPRLNI